MTRELTSPTDTAERRTADNVISLADRQNAPSEIARLAVLTPFEYEQERGAAAKRLGVRPSALDKLVKTQRSTARAPEDVGLESLAPWPRSVDGAEIAEEIRRSLLSHVVFSSSSDAGAATLWVVGTYLMGVWPLWPKLLIRSPQKRCGKTTLLETVEGFVYRGMTTSNISAAALFRAVEAWRPTLLIDEADRFLKGDDALNGLLNAGHRRRAAFVTRVEEIEGQRVPRRFSVWGPQVIATIGRQAGTLEDRSVIVDLRRKLPSDRVRKLPLDHFERSLSLRRKLLRWSEDNAAAIKLSASEPPPCGNDRTQDNWTPLWRIAEAIGGDWPARARAAYLVKAEHCEDDESVAVELLKDIATIIGRVTKSRVPTDVLLTALNGLDDRPWREFGNGEGMTAHALARHLKPFGATPGQYRDGPWSGKGYDRTQLEDAIRRYCGSAASAEIETPKHRNEISGLTAMAIETEEANVSIQIPSKVLNSNECFDVSICGDGFDCEGEEGERHGD